MKAKFDGKMFEVTPWPVGNVIPYELNAKKHGPEQVKALAKLIRNNGWTTCIVVDKYGVIIQGHGRRLAAIELGDENPWPGPGMVPVLQLSHLTPDQVKAQRLGDNEVALSDIDPEKLMASLKDMDDTSLLEGIFDDKTLNYLDADLATVNSAAFVNDMAAVVKGQQDDVEKRLANVKGSRVPLVKAFGFKDIDATGQIVIASLMARAEAYTGLEGDAAFLKWAESQLALGAA